MSEQYDATLLMSEFVTHNVKRFVVTKPAAFDYRPGQGVELAIDHPDWRDEGRPFTPANLVTDNALEFVIKKYPSHNGVTEQLHQLESGAKLLLSPAFGTIAYRGPGVFLAGGAGITPFLAILREQMREGAIGDSTLIYSNKTPDDVICEKELRHYLGDRCVLTYTDASAPGMLQRRIDRDLLARLIDDFSQPFYVCGPPGFMEAVNQSLRDLGAEPENLIFEQ